MEAIGMPSVDKHIGDGLKELKASSPDAFKLFAFFSVFGTSRLSLLFLIAAIQRKRYVSGYQFPWNRRCVLPNGMFDHPSWRKISTVLKEHKLFKCEDIPGSYIQRVSIEPEVCESTQKLLDESERERLVVLAADGLQFLISYLSLTKPSATMTFIPNMECLWENVRQVNHMTDGSPNFSLATLRMFLSHFRLNEKTMDLAWNVQNHMRQRWSEHICKYADEDQKTGKITPEEMDAIEIKASQYKAEARYDKGIEVFNEVLGQALHSEQPPHPTRLSTARDEFYSIALREAQGFLHSELELSDPYSEPINKYTLSFSLAYVGHLHRKLGNHTEADSLSERHPDIFRGYDRRTWIASHRDEILPGLQPQLEVDRFYLTALHHACWYPGDQCFEI
ncbi:MAG: hypothetical protein LBE67_16535 [Kocuria palustris]|jgi:hypothetical protein|uniref:Uncharacterized protein n=1 Tax=Penicillium chrysogenum TaxID=5076 RepID=A0ABQ8WZ21_PENCH|nr:hypothetical protein N7505_002274 [Penicillium chrysogenum]KAJ6167581.1 hypothetical protein N7497_000424 [Penicillium chrysogenum]MBZ6376531.1 hypothetical protein [Kocuria palustris]